MNATASLSSQPLSMRMNGNNNVSRRSPPGMPTTTTRRRGRSNTNRKNGNNIMSEEQASMNASMPNIKAAANNGKAGMRQQQQQQRHYPPQFVPKRQGRSNNRKVGNTVQDDADQSSLHSSMPNVTSGVKQQSRGHNYHPKPKTKERQERLAFLSTLVNNEAEAIHRQTSNNLPAKNSNTSCTPPRPRGTGTDTSALPSHNTPEKALPYPIAPIVKSPNGYLDRIKRMEERAQQSEGRMKFNVERVTSSIMTRGCVAAVANGSHGSPPSVGASSTSPNNNNVPSRRRSTISRTENNTRSRSRSRGGGANNTGEEGRSRSFHRANSTPTTPPSMMMRQEEARLALGLEQAKDELKSYLRNMNHQHHKQQQQHPIMKNSPVKRHSFTTSPVKRHSFNIAPTKPPSLTIQQGSSRVRGGSTQLSSSFSTKSTQLKNKVVPPPTTHHPPSSPPNKNQVNHHHPPASCTESNSRLLSSSIKNRQPLISEVLPRRESSSTLSTLTLPSSCLKKKSRVVIPGITKQQQSTSCTERGSSRGAQQKQNVPVPPLPPISSSISKTRIQVPTKQGIEVGPSAKKKQIQGEKQVVLVPPSSGTKSIAPSQTMTGTITTTTTSQVHARLPPPPQISIKVPSYISSRRDSPSRSLGASSTRFKEIKVPTLHSSKDPNTTNKPSSSVLSRRSSSGTLVEFKEMKDSPSSSSPISKQQDLNNTKLPNKLLSRSNSTGGPLRSSLSRFKEIKVPTLHSSKDPNTTNKPSSSVLSRRSSEGTLVEFKEMKDSPSSSSPISKQQDLNNTKLPNKLLSRSNSTGGPLRSSFSRFKEMKIPESTLRLEPLDLERLPHPKRLLQAAEGEAGPKSTSNTTATSLSCDASTLALDGTIPVNHNHTVSFNEDDLLGVQKKMKKIPQDIKNRTREESSSISAVNQSVIKRDYFLGTKKKTQGITIMAPPLFNRRQSTGSSRPLLASNLFNSKNHDEDKSNKNKEDLKQFIVNEMMKRSDTSGSNTSATSNSTSASSGTAAASSSSASSSNIIISLDKIMMNTSNGNGEYSIMDVPFNPVTGSCHYHPNVCMAVKTTNKSSSSNCEKNEHVMKKWKVVRATCPKCLYN